MGITRYTTRTLRGFTMLGPYPSISGDLEPLKGCTALQHLLLSDNYLNGGLEPLKGCTALMQLRCSNNQITGGLEPLRCCPFLRVLDLEATQLVPTVEDKAYFEEQCYQFII